MTGFPLYAMAEADELFDAYCGVLYSWARRYVRDAAAAEDVVQDVFAVLLGRWPVLDDPMKFRAYLFTVTRNCAMAALRRQPTLNQLPSENLDPGFMPALPSAEEEALVNSETRITIRVLLQLPRRQRETLALALDGYSAAEIARLLGITPNAVRVNLHHAPRQGMGHLEGQAAAAGEVLNGHAQDPGGARRDPRIRHGPAVAHRRSAGPSTVAAAAFVSGSSKRGGRKIVWLLHPLLGRARSGPGMVWLMSESQTQPVQEG